MRNGASATFAKSTPCIYCVGGFCLTLLLWGTAGNWRQSKTGATARRSAGVGRLAGPGVDCPTEVASVARNRVAANEVAIAKE